jgi:hypothetical protein
MTTDTLVSVNVLKTNIFFKYCRRTTEYAPNYFASTLHQVTVSLIDQLLKDLLVEMDK